MASAYSILGWAVTHATAGNFKSLEWDQERSETYIVSSIVVSSANLSSPNYVASFTLCIPKAGSGSGLGPQTAIFYNVPIEKGTDVTFTLGITLDPSEQMYVSSNVSSGLTVTAFGEKIT